MHVVVLGGGSTGEHFVWALRRLDTESEITLVERRLVGGECSYWACLPTKTALRGPEIHADAERSFGAVTGAQLDAERVFAWRDWVAERDDASQVEWLASKNAALVRGDGVVDRPGVVRVGDRELPYDRLVVATGSSPAIPPIDGSTRSTTGRTGKRRRRRRSRSGSWCSGPARSAASWRSSSGASARR